MGRISRSGLRAICLEFWGLWCRKQGQEGGDVDSEGMSPDPMDSLPCTEPEQSPLWHRVQGRALVALV